MIIIIGLLFLKKQETDSGNFSSSLTKYYQFCTIVGIPSERKAKEAMCLFCFCFLFFVFVFVFFFITRRLAKGHKKLYGVPQVLEGG